jgi:hypothetical protein
MAFRKLSEIFSRRIDSSGNLAANTINLAGRFSQAITSVESFNINCSLGNYFTKTVSSNSTFSVSNVPSGESYSFTLVVTHTSGSIGWFSGVKWSQNTAPVLTTNRKHVFIFITNDGGTNWFGAVLPNYTN